MAEMSDPVSSRLRILFLTQYYPPETAAAPARAHHFARALARAGHKVNVVTGLPNHPGGVIQPGYRPGDTESSDGITVDRTWLYATPKKTPINRLRNQLSFAFSSAQPALGKGPCDLVLVSLPPPFVGITAWLAARKHQAPLIVDIRDDWPRAAIALGEMRNGLVSGLLSQLTVFLYRKAARIVCVTDGMRRSLTSRGIEPGYQVLITNGADTDTFRPGRSSRADRLSASSQEASSSSSSAPLTVLYAGTHGLIHGMDVILDAASLLKGNPALSLSGGLRFRFVGDGVAKPGLIERAGRLGLENAEFLPAQSPQDLALTMESADICVVTTRDHPFSGETIPVKLFDYLAAGKPVVGAVSGDAADVLEASGGGVVVSPGDGPALAKALVHLAQDREVRERLGRSGASFVEENYSRRVLGRRMVDLCEEVVALSKGREVAPVPGGSQGAIKRVFDVAVAALVLLLGSPLIMVIALLIRLDSPGPVLFRQRRPGRGSREFTMVKFRTMRVGTPDLATHLAAGALPITRIGRVLRRTSLDELPQLIHVLRGEMSLVGPRPALYNQYDLIGMRHDRGIDALRPGITGWAQVNGRDDIPLDRKVALDHEYLRRVSFGLDLAVLMRTFTAVFTGSGSR